MKLDPSLWGKIEEVGKYDDNYILVKSDKQNMHITQKQIQILVALKQTKKQGQGQEKKG